MAQQCIVFLLVQHINCIIDLGNQGHWALFWNIVQLISCFITLQRLFENFIKLKTYT